MKRVKRGQDSMKRKEGSTNKRGQGSTNLDHHADEKRARPESKPAGCERVDFFPVAGQGQDQNQNQNLLAEVQQVSPPAVPDEDDEAVISPPPARADDAESDDELADILERLDVGDGVDDILKNFGVDGESSALGQFKEEREAEAAVSSRPSCLIVSGGDGRSTSPVLKFAP